MSDYLAEPIPVGDALAAILSEVDVEPSEDGRLSRKDLNRVLAAVYGDVAKRMPFHRRSYRALVDALLFGRLAGEAKFRDDEETERKRKAAEAERNAKAKGRR